MGVNRNGRLRRGRSRSVAGGRRGGPQRQRRLAGVAGLVESVLGVAEVGEVLGEGGEVEHEAEGGCGLVVASEAAGGGDEPGHDGWFT
jgi:hypothetical protein